VVAALKKQPGPGICPADVGSAGAAEAPGPVGGGSLTPPTTRDADVGVAAAGEHRSCRIEDIACLYTYAYVCAVLHVAHGSAIVNSAL
jgi:hypothetical protein